jgi:actin-related protein
MYFGCFCRMCETMFEKYSAPALFLSKDAVLAAYACGKTGGLVIDVGASGTVVTPVQDGWVESKGLCRSLAGGRLIDAHVRSNVLTQVLAQCLRVAGIVR